MSKSVDGKQRENIYRTSKFVALARQPRPQEPLLKHGQLLKNTILPLLSRTKSRARQPTRTTHSNTDNIICTSYLHKASRQLELSGKPTLANASLSHATLTYSTHPTNLQACSRLRKPPVNTPLQGTREESPQQPSLANESPENARESPQLAKKLVLCH